MKSDFTSAYQRFIRNFFIQEDFSWPKEFPENLISEFLHRTRNDGIQLLIHEKASQNAAWKDWPQSVREDFSRAAQNDAIVDTLRQQDFAELYLSLSKEEILPVLLKGAALSLTHYDSSYLRPRIDTDFLIPETALNRLNVLMPQWGYRSEVPTGREYGNYQISFSKRNAAGINVIYDVHWKLCNPELFASTLSYAEILEKSGETSLLNIPVKTISPAHALLHACIHLVAHHSEEQKLIWLYDIHLLAHGQTADWFESFYTLAAAKKVCRVAGHGLKLASEHFNTAIPGGVLEKLENPGHQETSARFLKMTPSVFSVFLENMTALPGRKKIRLLYQNLFPSSQFLTEKYRIKHRILLPAFYLWRILAGIPGVFRPLRKKV